MGESRFRRQARAIGLVVLVALVVVLCWPAHVHHAQAQPDPITLNPSSGPPGTTITITPTAGTVDTQDAANTQIAAYFFNACDGTTQQGASGSIGPGGSIPTLTLTVPTNATVCPSSSQNNIVYIGLLSDQSPIVVSNGAVAFATFALTGVGVTGTSPTPTATVTPVPGAPQISVSPTSVTPGSSFTISGTNFPLGATITLILINTSSSATTVLSSAIQAQNGAFTSSFSAPSTTGTYTVQALFNSVAINGPQLFVSQSSPTPTGATLTVTPLLASPGQSVMLSGRGFAPGGQITISSPFGTSTVQADPGGTFSTSLSVPTSTTISVITITAIDSSGHSANAQLSINTGQQVTFSVSANTATPGQALTVTGGNFAAGEQVTLALASPSTPTVFIGGTTQTATANAAGSLSATYMVPTVAAGSYLVVALGQSSNRSASASLTVQGIVTVTPTATATTAIVPFATETPFTYIPPTATATTVPTAIPPTATATATSAAVATQTTYFAEGYTGAAATNGRATFQESLYLFNTVNTPTNVTVTYYVASSSGGPSKRVLRSVHLAAQGTSMLSVNADVGNDRQVSVAVGHVPGVTARMVYSRSDPKGMALDAASSTGSTQAATNWSFAEGYAGVTFQEYVSVFNPGPAPAHVQIHFLPASGTAPAPLSYTVPATGRQSVNVSGLYLLRAGIHAPKSIALLVTSDQPIVADRTLYWGEGGGSGKYGYDVTPGTLGGSTTLIFAALLRAGADEPYITVLNPTSARVSLQVVFRNAAGQVLVSYTNTVAPLARLTIPLRSAIPTYSGVVSATMNATGPVVAEAPQYFGGSPNVGRHAGLNLLGSTGATTAALAGMDAKDATLYIYNPGNSALSVTALVGASNGSVGTASLTIPPLGITIASLPSGSSPRGLLLSAGAPFVAELINGSDTTQAAWGSTLAP